MGARWSSPAAQAASIKKSLEKLSNEIKTLRTAQESGNFSKTQQKKLCDLIIEHNDLVKGFKKYLEEFKQIIPEDNNNEFLTNLHANFNRATDALLKLSEDNSGIMAIQVAESFESDHIYAGCFREAAKITAKKNAEKARKLAVEQQSSTASFNQHYHDTIPARLLTRSKSSNESRNVRWLLGEESKEDSESSKLSEDCHI